MEGVGGRARVEKERPPFSVKRGGRVGRVEEERDSMAWG